MDGIQRTVYQVVALPEDQPLSEQVNQACAALKEAREELFTAVQRANEAKSNLEFAEAEAWKEKKVEGANERERKAWLRQHLAEYYQEAEQADQDLDAARLEYDLAQLEWQRIKLLCSIQFEKID